MKKTYVSPKTEAFNLECKNMIAASLMVYDTEVTSGDILSREDNDFSFGDDGSSFGDDEFSFGDDNFVE